MPTYHASLLNIDENETRRYAGLAGRSNFPTELVQRACSDAQLLAKPKSIWQIYPYDAKSGTILSNPPLPLQGSKIIQHLMEAKEVAVLGVTIGDDIEKKISRLFTEGEYSAGYLLDAAGTTAVEMAADQTTQIIARQAARSGFATTWRFSPGYGDWNVSVQPCILALAQAEDIGLTATESCMLLPRKSVTAIIGFIPNQDSLEIHSTATTEISCNHCTQPDCNARKEGTQK